MPADSCNTASTPLSSPSHSFIVLVCLCRLANSAARLPRTLLADQLRRTTLYSRPWNQNFWYVSRSATQLARVRTPHPCTHRHMESNANARTRVCALATHRSAAHDSLSFAHSPHVCRILWGRCNSTFTSRTKCSRTCKRRFRSQSSRPTTTRASLRASAISSRWFSRHATHTRAHARTHARTRARLHTNTHTHTHTHARARAHAHTHAA
jgi:hypothetical protein